MAKKSKKFWVYLIWGLVVAAVLAFAFAPINRGAPRMRWRVPVEVNVKLPEVPKLPDVPALSHLPNLPAMPQLRDIPQEAGRALKQLEGAMPDMPEKFELPAYEEPSPVTAAKPPVLRQEVLPPPAAGKGRMALIIDDMGLVPSLSARAVRLPGAVTLSYLPYASDLASQAAQAKAAGHELMLHLPMEPMGSAKPGPGALLVSQSEDEMKDRLAKALNSFEGYVGVNNHMGSKFTMDRKGMAVVSDVLREKNLFYVDSRTGPKTVAEEVARQAGVRTIGRDVFLDDDISEAAVRGQLARAEQVAKRKGVAVVIGHPHPSTLKVLEEWLPKAESRGIEIVTVSQILP